MGLMNLIVNKEPPAIEWIEGGILWDICIYKMSGIPTAEQLLLFAQDKELKKMIRTGIDELIFPHVEKIRGFLLKEGLEAPKMPDKKPKVSSAEAYSPSSAMDDADIAAALRNVFRLGLNIEIQGITKGTRADISYLIKEILNEDIEAYISLIKLSYANNWVVMTPPLPARPS